jgi:hypothetical protein
MPLPIADIYVCIFSNVAQITAALFAFFNKRWVLASTHYRQSPGHNRSCLFYSCIALLCKASLLRRTLDGFGTHLEGSDGMLRPSMCGPAWLVGLGANLSFNVRETWMPRPMTQDNFHIVLTTIVSVDWRSLYYYLSYS